MSDYNQKLEDLIDHHLISNEELEKKKELGGVGYLLNGNMCFGIYEDLLVARIGKDLAETLVSKDGIDPYLPDNKEFDEFVSIKEGIYTHRKALSKFIERSITYTRTLPPKEHDQDDLQF